MIYYKIQNFAEVGSGYQYGCSDWVIPNGGIEITEEEYKQVNVKKEKLANLQAIYSKYETWEFTLKDVDGTLTKNSDWLLSKISTKPIFFNDDGEVISKDFSVAKVFEIIDKINEKGFETFITKKILTERILKAKDTVELDDIDIEAEFAKIDKIINIA